MTYFLRTTPIWMFPSLINQIDDCVRNCLEMILNITLEDKHWLQATLPIRHGGLGIRRMRDICIPAFLASANGVSDFVKSINFNSGDVVSIPYLDEAEEEWRHLNPQSTPPTRPEIQKLWDDVNNVRIQQNLYMSSTSDVDKARFLAIRERESGSWLRALPSTHMGTLLDDVSFRIAVGLRLGCKLCHTHVCLCGATVDHLGLHGLSCPKSAGRYSRHSSINDIIKRALISAGLPTTLEPTGICRRDGKRPDGLTLIPWAKGQSLLWDATCVDTMAPSHLKNSCRRPASAAHSAVVTKKLKYKEIMDNYHFVIFAVETFGPWCEEAKSLTTEIGHKLQAATGEPRSLEYLRQRIGIAIQRGNAASVMGTFPEQPKLEEIYYVQSSSSRS